MKGEIMTYNYCDIVGNLQNKIYEAYPKFIEEYNCGFEYTTDGFVDIIRFNGQQIYHSEDDSITFSKELDDYISQDEFEKKLIQKAANIYSECLVTLLKIVT